MPKGHSFKQVRTMADDAITVRIKQVDGDYIGALDFPSFQKQDGTILKASTFSALPVEDALELAIRLQPLTPFTEIVVQVDHSVQWRAAWGRLIEMRA